MCAYVPHENEIDFCGFFKYKMLSPEGVKFSIKSN